MSGVATHFGTRNDAAAIAVMRQYFEIMGSNDGY